MTSFANSPTADPVKKDQNQPLSISSPSFSPTVPAGNFRDQHHISQGEVQRWDSKHKSGELVTRTEQITKVRVADGDVFLISGDQRFAVNATERTQEVKYRGENGGNALLDMMLYDSEGKVRNHSRREPGPKDNRNSCVTLNSLIQCSKYTEYEFESPIAVSVQVKKGPRANRSSGMRENDGDTVYALMGVEIKGRSAKTSK